MLLIRAHHKPPSQHTTHFCFVHLGVNPGLSKSVHFSPQVRCYPTFHRQNNPENMTRTWSSQYHQNFETMPHFLLFSNHGCCLGSLAPHQYQLTPPPSLLLHLETGYLTGEAQTSTIFRFSQEILRIISSDQFILSISDIWLRSLVYFHKTRPIFRDIPRSVCRWPVVTWKEMFWS